MSHGWGYAAENGEALALQGILIAYVPPRMNGKPKVMTELITLFLFPSPTCHFDIVIRLEIASAHSIVF